MSGGQPEPHRCKHGCERDALKDDVAKLRAALDRIAERTCSHDPCRALVQIARDALRPAKREHVASGDCWCLPLVDYIDPDTEAKVLVHREPQ